MSFVETLRSARQLLRREGRLSVRALRREFGLDEETADELVEELVDVQRVAIREGRVLVWRGTQGTSATEPEPATAAATSNEAERRQLTVLFCDLVESTRLAAGLDPEDWCELVRRYQAAVAQVVEGSGGYMAQYLGDGVLAYFGFPQAHEYDAENAVRAGLGAVGAVSTLNETLAEQHGCELSLRIGIHTGPVVVGEMGDGTSRETLAMGDTTNVAAHLQAVAEPDTVVMSAATLRLVSGIFVTHDLGERTLKNLDRPVRAYRAVQPSGVRSRLDVVAATELTPFVGRDQELMLLEDRFAQVAEGGGQAVLVCGEAGIGKSRLMQAFRERVGERAHTWLECRGSPYGQDSALYPVLELHRQALGFRAEDPAETKLGRIEAGLRAADFDLAETVPILAALHGVPLGERYETRNLSPEGMRKQTLTTLTEWLLRLGRHQPLVLLLEDLHWMDPSSLELLDSILEQVPAAEVLLLATYRPDFEPAWGARSFVTPMLLSRFTRAQLGDLVRKAARGQDLPEPWVAEILRRSDGVPLFAEELTRAVLETRAESPTTGAAPPLHIPETLQDSLMARLDSLGPVKELAQLGAVLGREFSYDLLLAASPMKETELRATLAAAVREELFYQRGTPPAATCLFRHALIRDAAYESMLRSTRQRHHRRVADALLERMPEVAASQPELVAHHLSEAGDAERALDWWIRAGERANARADYTEGISYLRRGLALLPALAGDPIESELRLQILLGMALVASLGYAAPETQEAWSRARELCDPARDPRRAGLVHYYLASGHLSGGEYERGLELYGEVVALGEATGNAALRLAGHHGSGIIQQYLGRLREGESSLSAAIALADAAPERFLGTGPLRDPALLAHGWLAWNEWARGYPERSRDSSRRAIELARASGEPYAISYMTTWGAVGATFRRDWPDARELALEAIRFAEEQGYAFNAAVARFAEAAAALMSEGDDSALDRFTAALGEAGSAGNRSGGTVILGSFVALLLAAGRLEQAAQQVDGALGLASAIDEGFYLAELHRLKGEVVLRLGDGREEAADALFRRAIDIARAQEGLSLELRATTSLARLRLGLGRGSEARELLQPVYDAFTEGFDLPDLQEARSLLLSLPRPGGPA